MRHFSGWMRPPPFAIWVASICALFGAVFARAQGPQAAQGPPIIRSIDVQYVGPETVSKERILAHMRTKVGQPYSNRWSRRISRRFTRPAPFRTFAFLLSRKAMA